LELKSSKPELAGSILELAGSKPVMAGSNDTLETFTA